jgi:serine phosphatase RsbU (regulator of sigma subunit)
MKRSLKLFASRILLAHLLALVVIIFAVVFIARDVYRRAQEQAVQQAIERQKLLAWQTARGIEGYYESIGENLDLLKRDNQQREDRFILLRNTTSPLAAAEMLWHQLEGRVTNLFGVALSDKTDGARAIASQPRSQLSAAQQIADAAKGWLRTVEGRPAISRFGEHAGHDGHLVALQVPSARRQQGNFTTSKLLLVAAVPLSPMEQRFLRLGDRDSATRPSAFRGGRIPEGAALTMIDDTGMVLASADRHQAGDNLIRDASDPRVREMVGDFLRDRRVARVQIIDQAFTAADGAAIPPRIIRLEPVKVIDQTWAVLASTPMAEVNAVVSGIFRRALLWSAIIVIATTAVLVSTSTLLIRQRLRLEQMRSEMLARELTQARQIQLAWLPRSDVVSKSGKRTLASMDLAAVNEPANHVSGDFYDWFELPDGRVVVTIGDVTGHGISAAFLMATAQLLIRTTMLRTADPGRCLEEVNRQLCSQVFNGQFVTVLVMVLDLRANVLEAATAGHFPPILCHGRQLQPLAMQNQLVLGVERDETYPTERFELSDDFTLLMYTDGVIDARSPDGRRFTLQGITSVLSSAEPARPNSIVQSIVRAVERFRGPVELDDDLTIVAVRAQPHAGLAPTADADAATPLLIQR